MEPWHLALVLLLVSGNVAAEPGYILLSPDILELQSTVQMKLVLVDVEGTGEVLVSLAQVRQSSSVNEQNIATVVVEKRIQIEEEREVNFGLNIPMVKELPNYSYEYFLQINGSFSNLNISKEVRIQIKDPSFNLLVQTDKPLYKPGQLVQFRLLTIDQELRPLRGVVGDVRIEDPSGARLANWLNQTFTRGISQYSFQLIDEPPLGYWRIVTEIKGRTFTTSFEVKEYVLPKFDLTITPPSYVLKTDPEITWQICATYTYGKPVAGVLELNASYVPYPFVYGFIVPYAYTKILMNGCYNYTVVIANLEEQRPENLTINYYDPNSITLHAELRENGTGNVVEADNTVYRYLELDVTLSFEDNLEYFKPGFPIYQTLMVTRPDDTPAPDVPVELCYTTRHDRSRLCWTAESLYMACRNYTSDSEGKIKFGVPMQGQDVTALVISANYTKAPTEEGQDPLSALATANLRSWYSPSQSFIQIQPVRGDLPCGKKTTVSVLFYGNVSQVTIYYQIISKGRMVTQGQAKTCPRCKIVLDPDNTFIYAPSSDENIEAGQDPSDIQFLRNLDKAFPVPRLTSRLNIVNVSFTPSFSLAPEASLLVYYVRSDGEVVADSTTLSVAKCLKNQAEMEFNTTKDYPGAAVSYELTTQRESWCGVTAVDSSLYLLSNANRLDISQIYNYLSQLTVRSYFDQTTPRTCPPSPRCHAKFYLAGKPRSRSKRSIVEPPPYPPAPSSQNSEYLDSLEAFQRSGTKIITNLNVEVRPCPINNDAGPVPFPVFKNMRESPLADNDGAAASGGSVSGGGQAQSGVAPVQNRFNFPETWLWDLVYVPNGQVTKQAELPHTLTTWTGNAVCIHPQKGIAISPSANITGFQPFFVSVNLPYSVIRGETVPVVVSVSNYLDVCLPVRITLDNVNQGGYRLKNESVSPEARICVCGGEVTSTIFDIVPKDIGSVNVTASAISSADLSACEGRNWSTQAARDTETRVLLVEPEGIPQQITQSAMICASDGNVTSIDVSPPDDDNLVPDSVRVYRLVSGDLLGAALQHLDSLLLIPMGTGFTTLVRYLPNILLLRYLEATGQVNDQLKQEALSNMRAGYQRMLSFKRYDGSYAPFGSSDASGSIELTAEVVETNHEASQYINVDQNDLAVSQNWVVSKQDPADGCFPVLGSVHSSYLRGDHGRSTITALVLAALLGSGYQDNSTLVSNAVACIKLDTTPPVYTLAIAAYAFSLAGREEDARRYLKLLDDKAFFDNGYKYWLPEAESGSGGPLSMDESSIEVAGYVAMAMIQLDGKKGISQVLPVIRGLVSKMNVNGGFYSTQDTLVGLKALTKYSSLLTPEDLARNLDVVFTPGPKTFRVDDSNRLVQQMDRQDGNCTKLEVTASGQGCAMVQVQVRYNVLTPPKPLAFNLSANVSEGQRDCQLDLQICYSYLLDGLSNIVTMEVRMVSGFEPLLITLDLLRGNAGIEKYTYNNQVINFFFNSMSKGEKCLKFGIAKVQSVQDVQPGNIRIMDVYKQDRSATIEYEVGEVTCN